MAEMAREIAAKRDLLDKEEHLLKAAQSAIPSCSDVGLTLVSREGRLETPATTGEVPRRGDELQYQLRQGPCVDAIREEAVIHSYDLADEDRWPQWAPRMVEQYGVRSMLCVRLWTRRRDVGALNLYSAEPGSFVHDERETAMVVAAHVAATLAAAEEIDQMHTAMERRTTIGVAIGLVMQRYDLDRTTAFEMLRRLSQERNQKLHEMAAGLSRDGALDTTPDTAPDIDGGRVANRHD